MSKRFHHPVWDGPPLDPRFFGAQHFQHRGGHRRESGEFPRRRRGEMKFILLELLSERPQHGYELIKELEDRAGGFRRFSPGSVYPTLQMLEEAGYLTSEQVEDKRVYTITDSGKKLLSDRLTPPESPEDFAKDKNPELLELRKSMMELNEAVTIVARNGNKEQTNQVTSLIAKLKREIYKILAGE